MHIRSADKGFTLVEVVVVILLVSILAAASVPLMQGRLDSAKWAEGKALMGSIAKALRVHAATEGDDFVTTPTLEELGFEDKALMGTYFKGRESANGDFTWAIHQHDPIRYTITATAPSGIRSPVRMVLDQTGEFTESPD